MRNKIFLLALFAFIVLGVAYPAHATFTPQLTAAITSCTSGTTCGPSVTLTCSATELCAVMAHYDNGSSTGPSVSSCCGGSGCTWTNITTLKPSNGTETLYWSNSCTVTSTVIGPTWASACTTNVCGTMVQEWTSTGGGLGVDGTACTTGTATWCSPTSLTSDNDVFISTSITGGTITACGGGSSPACKGDSNGNGSGYEQNVAGTSYSAPTWTGASGTTTSIVAAIHETSAASTCGHNQPLLHAGC